jgi:hypothetical protein
LVKNKELQNQLSKSHQTISSNAKSLLDIDILNKNLENQVKDREQKAAFLERDISILKNEIDNLKFSYEGNLNELKNKIIELEDFNLNEQNENDRLKAKLADLEDEMYINQVRKPKNKHFDYLLIKIDFLIR